MRRALVFAALALAAAAPASLGLVGNASFGRDVPVRVPTSAILVDEHGSEMQPTAKQTIRSADPTSRQPGREHGYGVADPTDHRTQQVQHGSDHGAACNLRRF